MPVWFDGQRRRYERAFCPPQIPSRRGAVPRADVVGAQDDEKADREDRARWAARSGRGGDGLDADAGDEDVDFAAAAELGAG
jgi:hypothetical protein